MTLTIFEVDIWHHSKHKCLTHACQVTCNAKHPYNAFMFDANSNFNIDSYCSCVNWDECIFSTSIMECMNSEVNPFSKVLQSMNSDVHDLFIFKILDYITIFKTMKQESDGIEPMWHDLPFTVPVLRYMKPAVESHSILKEISWDKNPFWGIHFSY